MARGTSTHSALFSRTTGSTGIMQNPITPATTSSMVVLSRRRARRKTVMPTEAARTPALRMGRYCFVASISGPATAAPNRPHPMMMPLMAPASVDV